MVEVETDREVKLCTLALQLEEMSRKPIPLPCSRPSSVSSPASSPAAPVISNARDAQGFDVGKYIMLVPPFRESEVDAYFVALERFAGTLKWPNVMWTLLLQCSLTGNA